MYYFFTIQAITLVDTIQRYLGADHRNRHDGSVPSGKVVTARLKWPRRLQSNVARGMTGEAFSRIVVVNPENRLLVHRGPGYPGNAWEITVYCLPIPATQRIVEDRKKAEETTRCVLCAMAVASWLRDAVASLPEIVFDLHVNVWVEIGCWLAR